MNLNEKLPQWGFMSNDGRMVPLASLTVSGLEFVNYSVAELTVMLTQKEQEERYEQCALIRDELIRRARP